MKSVLLFVFCTLFSLSALAQSKEEKLAMLLDEMKIEETYTMSLEQMKQMQLQMLQQSGKLQSQDVEKMSERLSRVADISAEVLNWEKLKGMIIEVYSTHFSEQEIDDMIAFYRSETGQAMVTKTPLINQDIMHNMQGLIGELTQKIDDYMSSDKQSN